MEESSYSLPSGRLEPPHLPTGDADVFQSAIQSINLRRAAAFGHGVEASKSAM
ncbi:hypothetical protein HMPREF0293_0921 [Corynebacterium glucuronolyticum ATCC 51866]|uniref:Uncharacterized protein n=1 Tax=Corynebacterium glucuronolyticum ATCC 51866 TaxID=548478 RepID=A0ABM9XQS6_9CORY|nr:hypothetical protein HMPREF0293_0921 [Corynebacterium glucuronolyticum ATCC 51866]